MRVRSVAVWIAVVCSVALVAGACGNASSSSKKRTTATSSTTAAGGSGGAKVAVNQPGVTNDTIRVGGVASITNPLNGPYGDTCKGVRAYFDMINSEGGIHGRKLDFVDCRDDQIANNQREVEALLSQDNVFAVAPIATILSFSGSKVLAAQGVPTFGWNINQEWEGAPNLFSNATALCFTCAAPGLPLIAKTLHKKKLGVLAYNVANSSDCATGIARSFEKYPVAKVVFDTRSLSFGATDFSAEVRQMKDKGVDFVTTCIDQNAVLNLAKEMKKQGLNAVQYLPNGYDQDFIRANAPFFEGSIVLVPFVPFESRTKPPGLKLFEKWMRKGGYKINEQALYGWIDGDELVTGLRGAGPDFTRQKVVDALNKLTSYTANGILAGLDWTQGHTNEHLPIGCAAHVKVASGGTFVPTFVPAGKNFVCLPDRPPTLPKPTYR